VKTNQQLITQVLPAVIVDRLVSIQVEVSHCELLTPPLYLRHRLLQMVLQQDAIGQVGEGINVGEVL